MDGDWRQRGRSRSLVFALCLFGYLYVSPSYPAINNPNENVRFYMTAALSEFGVYEIDLLRGRWGFVNDAAVHDGHVYSVKAPGVSFLALPGYTAYRLLQETRGAAFDRDVALWVCRLTASALPSVLWLGWFYVWLMRRGSRPFLVHCVFFSVAFGSLLYGYGLLLVSHTQSAIAASSAFMLLTDAREAELSPHKAFWAGIFTAGVTWFEYPGLPCSVVLAVYGLWVLRGSALRACFVVGGSLPTLALMHFQWRAFGSPFTPGHLMVENAAFRAAHHQGLYGAVGPSAEALKGLLLDLGAGLFPLTPILLFALPGLWLLLRERGTRAAGVCLTAIVVLTVLAIASMNNWRGGWTIGPRYLALLVPLLAWPALRALEAARARFGAVVGVVAIACTLSAFLASGLPGVYYPHIPEEFSRPVSELIAVLIAHGYAPLNAGNLLGLYGNGSMLPLLVCGGLAVWCCVEWERGSLRATSELVIAALFCGAFWWAIWQPAEQPGARIGVAFVTERWNPPGHDRASRLRERLKAQSKPSKKGLRALAELYEREGRDGEAQRVRAGLL